MIIQCSNCARKFVVRDKDIPKEGRMVQCGYCSQQWLQKPSKINIPSKTKKRAKKKDKLKIETTKKEINPSSQETVSENKASQVPDIYKKKESLGFFGFIILMIVVTFSLVGVLKTFEKDLLIAFPETDYIFQILNEQLEYISETIKNMITIIKDLIDYY